MFSIRVCLFCYAIPLQCLLILCCWQLQLCYTSSASDRFRMCSGGQVFGWLTHELRQLFAKIKREKELQTPILEFQASAVGDPLQNPARSPSCSANLPGLKLRKSLKGGSPLYNPSRLKTYQNTSSVPYSAKYPLY